MMMKSNVLYVNHWNWRRNSENLICLHHGNNSQTLEMQIPHQKKFKQKKIKE